MAAARGATVTAALVAHADAMCDAHATARHAA
jgi:hypothetical protein